MINYFNYKNKTTLSFWLNCLIISILFENFKLFTFFGASIKVIHILLIAIIIKCFVCTGVEIKKVPFILFFLLIPLFPLYRVGDYIEWFKTYFVYAIIVLYFGIALKQTIIEIKTNFKHYVRLFIGIICFAQILGIIQFFLMNFFGYFFLYNIFGSFQFHVNQFGKMMGFYRSYSLFLEPSFFAWVSISALSVLLIFRKIIINKIGFIILFIINTIAIFLSISSSGIIMYVVLVFLFVLIRSKSIFKNILLTFLVICFLLVIWNFTNILKPIERIFIEVDNSNSSGFERLVVPLHYLKNVMEYYPVFGRGLGQQGEVDLIGKIGRYESINNGFIGLMCAFGLSSLCFFVPSTVYFLNRIKNNRLHILLFAGIFAIYISTGAFCAVDTFIFLILLISFGESYCPCLKNNIVLLQ